MRAKAGQIASHLLKTAIEPNSVVSDAITITGLKAGESRVFSGELNTTTDVDVFALPDLAVGQTISAAVNAKTLSPASTLDSFLRIFNPSGTQVAFNDDSGGTTDSSTSWTVATTGPHYVGVSAYKNQTYDVNAGTGLTVATTTGPYRTRISLS